MDFTLIIGAVGAGLLLIAFALSKFGVMSEKSAAYDLLNLLGAGLLTWYAVLLRSIPFIVLEGIWTLIAVWYVGKRLVSKA